MAARAEVYGGTLTARSRRRAMRRLREAPIKALLFACALLSVFTTAGIILVLIEEAFLFFREVPVLDFLTGTRWAPQFANSSFGVVPIVSATLLMSVLAMVLAIPLGVLAALYLSEYAHPSVRKVVKPVLEVLAGIPTVVYGYFALTFITPDLLRLIFGTSVGVFNVLAASMAVGVMILPLVASLSEDAMRSVPQSLREGAYGLGATRFEVSVRVILPAALSGIMAAVILAVSRAVGETMIVAIAMGLQPNLSWNPLEGALAMTSYIVNVSLGDTPHDGIVYKSIFAVGMLLFLITLSMNIVAQWLLSRFREEYD
ncbi:MAG: phosphate ABC transporter permease subunit PstC [Chloroflexi bacterium]|nr:phosphate ABC transporter permease subunit PstC [Chloroflexota bacterium]MQC17411.1 phosphate ABC transporter permease subunit PstC [Chloroflexota bacterium]